MDGGKYAETVLSGDPHWANVLAMGLATGDRDKHNQLHTVVREDGAKRFAYAVIYGAQDLMAGSIVYECLLNAQRTCGDEGEALYREFFGMGVPGEQRSARSAARSGRTSRPALMASRTCRSASATRSSAKAACRCSTADWCLPRATPR
jgi:hypothetical protein